MFLLNNKTTALNKKRSIFDRFFYAQTFLNKPLKSGILFDWVL